MNGVFRRALTAAAGSLAIFHVWLFAGQLRNGELLSDPGLLARWFAALGLAGALFVLKRRGISLVVGRKAVAVWALVALLHGPALAGRIEAVEQPAVADAVTLLARIAAASIAGLWLLHVAFASKRRAPVLHEFFAALGLHHPALVALDVRPVVAPRPPPHS